MEFDQFFDESSRQLGLDLRSPAFTRFRRGALVSWIRILLLVTLDIGAVFLAWILAIKWGTPADPQWNILVSPSTLLLIFAVNVGILSARGLYKAGNYRRDYLGLVKAISLSQGLILLIAFLQNPNSTVSRSTFLLSWLLSTMLILGYRILFDVAVSSFRNQGVVCYQAFLISDQETLTSHVKAIESEGRYQIVGTAEAYALDRDKRHETLDLLRRLKVTEAFVSWDAIKNRLYLCWHFQRLGITLRILSSVSSQSFSKPEFCLIGGIPSFSLRAPTLIGSDYWIKRSFDFCGALLLLIVFSPLYLLIALLIKLDSPGAIFFRQIRVGLNGRTFKVWKFRTMVTNADQLQTILEATNEMKDGVLFKMKDDPRVTRVGRFLRAYSLDELPQLINVLLGEMSFVGPRPLPLRDVEKFKEHYFIRQEVLPGITGLWQVSGRSNIDNFEDAVKLDFTYIANWSLWLDLQIMLKTVQVVLKKSGAY